MLKGQTRPIPTQSLLRQACILLIQHSCTRSKRKKERKKGGKKNNVTIKKKQRRLSRDVRNLYLPPSSPLRSLTRSLFHFFCCFTFKRVKEHYKVIACLRLLEKVRETSVYCVHYISSHFSRRRGGAHAVCAKCSKVFFLIQHQTI